MKPKVKLQITTLFLLLLLPENAILWRRRRRRRAPAPVNCQVGSWTSWGSCSYPCGNSGTQTRTRAITVAAAHGGSCSYHLSESQACNRGNCQNGGTPHSTGCSCRAGYTGTCCSQDIDECLTSPCDHTCTNTFGSYTCQCNSCYTKLGTRCELRQCRISGSCYSYDTVNPNNQCQDCQSTNKMAWTNNDTLSCSDGVACTRNDTCSSGTCAGTPYTCLSCEECNNDTCRVKEGFCATVEGGTKTCFSHGDLRPGYPCQWCDPSISTSTWSNREGVACNDGDQCTRGDTCQSGRCSTTPFTCNSLCQYCNGSGCSLKTGFGFTNGCTCKIGGQDYNNQTVNPSNQCEWCDLYDATARANGAWSNRSAVPCDDQNRCTKQDTCNSGRCEGQAYSCQSSFPSTSCIKTSECVGDGTCREIIRASGTICRPAIDICDQPERCDGNRETCPGAEHDSISITTGSAQFTDQSFLSVISYHNLTNKLYVRLTGFSASCGQLNFQWFLLSSSSACITASTVKGAFPNSNTRQTLTGLPLQDNSNYKVSIQAVDMRNNTAQHVCSGVININ